MKIALHDHENVIDFRGFQISYGKFLLCLFTFHIGLLALHPEDRKNETLGVKGGSGEVYEHFVAHYKTCELKRIDFKDINKSM